ncbi:hypothetical protein BCR44DRAFT_1442247 [Catenaria anguillulae PL171]|uniref:Uncharacterized protein n=1 Tax=Catenaria anguillulae PL171 TaxID=765915 RepID=A0A1Y2HBN4_9FUNG|nr:hypothetical protein BCR44DRAFT_1442247 [Catenaria anguillulae PL171]
MPVSLTAHPATTTLSISLAHAVPSTALGPATLPLALARRRVPTASTTHLPPTILHSESQSVNLGNLIPSRVRSICSHPTRPGTRRKMIDMMRGFVHHDSAILLEGAASIVEPSKRHFEMEEAEEDQEVPAKKRRRKVAMKNMTKKKGTGKGKGRKAKKEKAVGKDSRGQAGTWKSGAKSGTTCSG